MSRHPRSQPANIARKAAFSAIVLLTLGACGGSTGFDANIMPGEKPQDRSDSGRRGGEDGLNGDSQSRNNGRTSRRDPNTTPPDTPPDQDPQRPQLPQIPPSASGGSGGPVGESQHRFTAANGKVSTWKIIAPTDVATKTYGLNIHLHGDGGGDYSWLYRPNARIAQKHGLLGVVVMAPNASRRWYQDGVRNAEFLHELIQKDILTRFNIDRTRIYFSGVSGGAQFLTGQFIPLYGLNYNTGAVLLCGGPANWQREFRTSPEFLSRFRLYWYSGTADFLYSQIVEGMRWYKSRGMQVESEMIPGAPHCEFPGGVSGALERKIALIIR